MCNHNLLPNYSWYPLQSLLQFLTVTYTEKTLPHPTFFPCSPTLAFISLTIPDSSPLNRSDLVRIAVVVETRGSQWIRFPQAPRSGGGSQQFHILQRDLPFLVTFLEYHLSTMRSIKSTCKLERLNPKCICSNLQHIMNVLTSRLPLAFVPFF